MTFLKLRVDEGQELGLYVSECGFRRVREGWGREDHQGCAGGVYDRVCEKVL